MSASATARPQPSERGGPPAFAGRTALITGGGGGIGVAVARALAGAGAGLILAARGRERVEALAAELRGTGAAARAESCDVTDPASVRELAESCASGARPVDVLVNNAGAAHSAPLHRLALEDWNRLFAVNATGTFLCTQAFLPAMLERGWGRVVNVASVAGVAGARYVAAYAAAKHAVVGFTRCVAAEVAGSGVTANAICPSYVDTPMTRESVERIASRTARTREEALRALLETAGQDRLIRPEEVAHAVLWLCDDRGAGVNGQAIVIDGGGLLR